MNIMEEIGAPAVFEQTAEECIELAHTCLKMARKMRGENPVRKDYDEIFKNLVEEIADVTNCLDILLEEDVVSHEAIESEMIYKRHRWKKHLKEVKEDERTNIKNNRDRD